MKVQDAAKLRVNLTKLARIAPQEMRKGLVSGGQELIRTAKILVPVGETGESRNAIHGDVTPEGYKIDFGPKSKVIEGGRKAGQTKRGRKFGAAPAQPFVNPALKATSKRRAARMRRAANRAVKKAMSDG